MVTSHMWQKPRPGLLGAAPKCPGPTTKRAWGLGQAEELFSKVLCRSGWWGEVGGPRPVTQPHCWAVTHAQAPSGRHPQQVLPAPASTSVPLQSLPWQLLRPVPTPSSGNAHVADCLVRLLDTAIEGTYTLPLLAATGWATGVCLPLTHF